ncbi:MAG TPA: hypothetical protein VL443_09035 [Cyclobacteriaceae bacterium]|jgi:hypothetical protein|nr:hypothetical protein [Cyclobacteriaceae bacterium]
MKINKITLTAWLLFMVGVAFGQNDVAFKVLVNKGKNEVKSGNDWLPVKAGASLKSADELRISENAYLGLVHASGKPVELKKAGTYKVATLSSQVGPGTSVLSKYTDFILSSNSADQRNNRLAATGAVHRGPEKIKVYLPRPELSIVFNNMVTLNWETDKAPAPYIVSFNSMFGDELTKVEAAGNTVTIDLNDISFANEDNIIVKVSSKTDPNKISDEYTLKRLSRADINRLKNSYNEIQGVVSDETAMSKLSQAGFYEENNLLVDAITAYQEAIKLAPDVPMFKEYYESFLLRHAIKEPGIKK